jgi:hypothetical protein
VEVVRADLIGIQGSHRGPLFHTSTIPR